MKKRKRIGICNNSYKGEFFTVNGSQKYLRELASLVFDNLLFYFLLKQAALNRYRNGILISTIVYNTALLWHYRGLTWLN